MKYCPHCAAEMAPQKVDGTQKTGCCSESCGYVFWNNPVPVVAALVCHEGEILLAQNSGWPKGLYSIITGYLDENETPEQGVIREVKEELDLDVCESSFIGHYSFADKNQLIIAFAVTASGTVKPNAEIAATKYLSVNELKAWNFDPLHITRSIVQDWFVGKD